MQHHHYDLAAGGIASDSTAVFYDMAVAYELNLNSGADQHDPSPTAAYEEIDVVAPRQTQLAADGYVQDTFVNRPQDIVYATPVNTAPSQAQLAADGYVYDASVNRPSDTSYATAAAASSSSA